MPGKEIKALKQEYASKLELLSEMISTDTDAIEDVIKTRLSEGNPSRYLRKH